MVMGAVDRRRASRGRGRGWRALVVWTVAVALATTTASVAAPAGPAAALPDAVVPLTAGSGSTCAITATGGLACWGGGTTTPTAVTGLGSSVIAAAPGSTHTCAVLSGGAVRCWGSNAAGQLGNGTTTATTAKVDVAGLGEGVVAIAAGTNHTCAVTDVGGVWCWGTNAAGLGVAGVTATSVPVEVTGLGAPAVAVATRTASTCALLATGTVRCWGANADGQLGNGTTTASPVPVEVVGLVGATSISVSGAHACATVPTGVRCWGDNTWGQLGDGTTTDAPTGTTVSGAGPDVVAVAAGGLATCTLSASGAVRCAGSGSSGGLGTSSTASSSTPLPVYGLAGGVVAIAAGGSHACALTATGGVRCWGANGSGQIGNGGTSTTAQTSKVPVIAGGLPEAASVSGGAYHTCALTAASAVRCVGRNVEGQLGRGATTPTSSPTSATWGDVIGLGSGARAAVAGHYHSCAITAAGGVRCWGDNTAGQLGDGTKVSSATPVDVVGLGSGVRAIAANNLHTCAVTEAGAAWCWGKNDRGQLGDGTVVSSTIPVPVVGLGSGVREIAVGNYSTCAVTDAGAAKCWGHGSSGQLGNSTNADSSIPRDVTGLSSGVTSIGLGVYHACATTTAGEARCWGSNTYGELGNNQAGNNRNAPVLVSGLSTGAVAVSVRSNKACAVTTSGAAKCWGRNQDGELGDNSTTQRDAPVTVSGMATGVAQVYVGSFHACLQTTIGRTWCWGSNVSGQLGAIASIPSPVLGGDGFLQDAPPPTITATRSPAPNADGWNDEPVLVSFTCSTPALVSCTAPITVGTEGADQAATGTVTDALGRSASTTVTGISVDLTAPTLAGVATTEPNEAGWHRVPVTVAWTCSDARSGVAPGACPTPSSTVGEGTAVTASATVADRAGNVTSAASQAVAVDLTPPSTTASTPPAWAPGDVALTLTPTDNLSGVATTSWSVDGGPTQEGTSPTITGEGVHTVAFWSTDAAGNVEPMRSVTVAIDPDAPTITATTAPAPSAAGWNRSDVSVSFTCTDGRSAIASCGPDQTLTGEVDTTVTGSAVDLAGNVATASVPVRIDRTAPQVSIAQPTPPTSGWFAGPVEVSFSCTDDGGSGVSSCPQAQLLTGEGADQVATGTATDAAGNERSATSAPISIDLTAPTLSGAVDARPLPSGGYLDPVTVRWTCADARSGIASCPAPQTVSGEGVHVVSASVADRAGNTATAEVTVQIDPDPGPGTVMGTVTDATTGLPVAGALVRVHVPGTQVAVGSATTGTDGRYVLPGVADGSYLVSITKSGAYLQSWYPSASTWTGAAPIELSRGVTVVVDQALAPGHVLAGRLTSATSGAPISGATVRVDGTGTTATATTDATGAWTVTGLVPGTRTITFLAAGHQTATTTVSVPSVSAIDRTLTPSPTSVGVVGTVTAASPAGKLLSGAVIKVYVRGAVNPAATATTGLDGRYALPDLPAGIYEVSVSRAYTRWLGNVIGRANGQLLVVGSSCTAPGATSCPAVADFLLPTA